MDNQIEFELLNTPEKFHPTVDTILTKLLELLKALSALEREIYERNNKLEKEKFKAGIPYNQTAPGSKELWKEYADRYKQLVTPVCTDRMLKLLSKYGYIKSFGKPGKYDYINTKCKIVCTMKSGKKATIETFYHQGIDMKHQFIFKSIDNEWKIDEIKYGFCDDTTWHTDHSI